MSVSAILQLCQIYNCKNKVELYDYIIYLYNQGEKRHSLEIIKDVIKKHKKELLLQYLEQENINLEFVKELAEII
jgi:hypothetical protein